MAAVASTTGPAAGQTKQVTSGAGRPLAPCGSMLRLPIGIARLSQIRISSAAAVAAKDRVAAAGPQKPPAAPAASGASAKSPGSSSASCCHAPSTATTSTSATTTTAAVTATAASGHGAILPFVPAPVPPGQDASAVNQLSTAAVAGCSSLSSEGQAEPAKKSLPAQSQFLLSSPRGGRAPRKLAAGLETQQVQQGLPQAGTPPLALRLPLMRAASMYSVAAGCNMSTMLPAGLPAAGQRGAKILSLMGLHSTVRLLPLSQMRPPPLLLLSQGGPAFGNQGLAHAGCHSPSMCPSPTSTSPRTPTAASRWIASSAGSQPASARLMSSNSRGPPSGWQSLPCSHGMETLLPSSPSPRATTPRSHPAASALRTLSVSQQPGGSKAAALVSSRRLQIIRPSYSSVVVEADGKQAIARSLSGDISDILLASPATKEDPGEGSSPAVPGQTSPHMPPRPPGWGQHQCTSGQCDAQSGALAAGAGVVGAAGSRPSVDALPGPQDGPRPLLSRDCFGNGSLDDTLAALFQPAGGVADIPTSNSSSSLSAITLQGNSGREAAAAAPLSSPADHFTPPPHLSGAKNAATPLVRPECQISRWEGLRCGEAIDPLEPAAVLKPDNLGDLRAASAAMVAGRHNAEIPGGSHALHLSRAAKKAYANASVLLPPGCIAGTRQALMFSQAEAAACGGTSPHVRAYAQAHSHHMCAGEGKPGPGPGLTSGRHLPMLELQRGQQAEARAALYRVSAAGESHGHIPTWLPESALSVEDMLDQVDHSNCNAQCSSAESVLTASDEDERGALSTGSCQEEGGEAQHHFLELHPVCKIGFGGWLEASLGELTAEGGAEEESFLESCMTRSASYRSVDDEMSNLECTEDVVQLWKC
eukprot:jgi/Mesen1/3450/ME000194S02611